MLSHVSREGNVEALRVEPRQGVLGEAQEEEVVADRRHAEPDLVEVVQEAQADGVLQLDAMVDAPGEGIGRREVR